MVTCLIDQTEHATADDLHRYLRKLKVKQEDYYIQYLPRKDALTGEQIPFKSVDQYLNTEFLSKENLRKWINQNPTQGLLWAVNWLAKRKVEKELVYPPTQVELRSLLCPTMHYYNGAGGYNKICQELGYKIRFEGEFNPFPSWLMEKMDDLIITDTREQLPLSINSTIRAKLNVGDYGLVPDHDVGVYIERKSIADFVGTMSLGYARFVREMERAKEVDAYIIILIEYPLDLALAHKPKHGNTSMAHVFKRLRDLLSNFTNVQALFALNHEESGWLVPKLLSAGTSVKHVDLQYLYECKKL